jgi:hypothetical protein
MPRTRAVGARRQHDFVAAPKPCCRQTDRSRQSCKGGRAAPMSPGLRIDSSCIAARTESSSAPLIYKRQIEAVRHVSQYRGRIGWARKIGEGAYNLDRRRRSSVVEQPPCKRQVVCSIQTGGTNAHTLKHAHCGCPVRRQLARVLRSAVRDGATFGYALSAVSASRLPARSSCRPLRARARLLRKSSPQRGLGVGDGPSRDRAARQCASSPLRRRAPRAAQ